MEDNMNLENIEVSKSSIKKDFRMVSLSSILYLLILEFIAIFLMKFTNNSALSMIVSTSLGVLLVFFINKNFSIKSVVKNNNRFMSLKDIFFFTGLMFIMTYVFGIVTNIMMIVFKIPSRNVTMEISSNLNLLLAVYAVIWGPLVEELQYRGVYLNKLKKHGVIPTILFTSLVFSFAHLNFMQGLGTYGIALVLAYVACFYSFRDALILHVINNFYALITSSNANFLDNGQVELNAISIIAIAIHFMFVGYTVYKLIKGRNKEISNNLKLNENDKFTLKIILKDPVILLYIVFIIGTSIALGFAK